MTSILADFLSVVVKMQDEDKARNTALGKLFAELYDVRKSTADKDTANRIEEAVAQARLSLFGDDGRP